MIKTDASIIDARLEGDVVQTSKAWATSFPAELVAFDRQQRALRASLLSKSGMSRGGNMLYAYEIPVTLDRLMSLRYGTRWRLDKRLRRYFFDNFKVGHVGWHRPGGAKVWLKV